MSRKPIDIWDSDPEAGIAYALEDWHDHCRDNRFRCYTCGNKRYWRYLRHRLLCLDTCIRTHIEPCRTYLPRYVEQDMWKNCSKEDFRPDSYVDDDGDRLPWMKDRSAGPGEEVY